MCNIKLTATPKECQIACNCADHPNAHSLRIYQMEATGYESIQIIANLDNIYQIGDVVAVALTDTILEDGTKIKPSKLRGIVSFGMAMEKVSAPIATDISAEYCPEIVEC